MMRLGFCAALLALALPLPALAQDGDYDRAVSARMAGNTAEAIALLEPMVAREPDNSDARVQLGYALLAAHREADAAKQFRAALAIAPAYRDAADGLALAEARMADDMAPASLALDGALAFVDGPQSNWQEVGATAVIPLTANNTWAPGATWFRRFGLEDVEFTTNHILHHSDDTWLRLSGSGTPAAEFRPIWSVGLGVDRRITDGPQALVASLDGRFQRFDTQDVWTLSPSVVKYLGDGSVSLTARANIVGAEDQEIKLGALGRVDWMASERSRLFVGAAVGPDTELGRVTQTHSLFAGGELPVSRSLSLTGSLAREWRDGPADRTEARLGVKLGL